MRVLPGNDFPAGLAGAKRKKVFGSLIALICANGNASESYMEST